MRRPTGLPILACVLATACGGSSPVERGRICRRYPTEMTINGTSVTCSETGCRTMYQHWSWSYRSRGDFVLEPRLPNRKLVVRESYHWTGHWAWMGSGGSETVYGYDPAGQLVSRHGGGATEYDAWDAYGRPVAGSYRSGPDETRFTVWYDDASRTMRTSLGEMAVQDANGNLLRKVEMSSGRLVPTEYVITATAEACIEP